jgi:hypothetical protein
MMLVNKRITIILGLPNKNFKILMKTQFASCIILLKEILTIKMQFPYVMDINKVCICQLLDCWCVKLGLLLKPLLTYCSLL